MDNTWLSRQQYIFFFCLAGIVYFIGLFVPLPDNDSAHHASIALRMHLTGDYASLVDQGGDYLDKPHLLFWLSSFSYKVFGVTGFAYKLPSFLFTILGVYSTYRLGKILYNSEVGKLAALLLATSFAFILAIVDVRMEAILTATIAFSSWQLISFVQHKRILNIVLGALGLALAFATKGHIGVLVPAACTFFYILYKKEYRLFYNWKWLLLLILFGVFISPVLYAYYLQYNLHPEKVVRGKDHIDGVKFILLNQSIERFSGGMGDDARNDYLFFFHSFLWAFAPWSVICFLAVGRRLRNFFSRKEEWGTTSTFIIVLVIVSLSGFKLPHYLNIVFPFSALMAAHLILNKRENKKWVSVIFIIQIISSVAILILAGVLNFWAMPVKKIVVYVGLIGFLATVIYFVRIGLPKEKKLVLISAATMLLFFFLMNSNFYPQLLKYQAGQQLAELTNGKVNPGDVYIRRQVSSYSSSYVFYSKSAFQPFDDSLLTEGRKMWILTEPGPLETIKEEYNTGMVYKVPHFHVTKLNLKFLNPSTREKQLSSMMIVEILSKK